MTKSAIMLRPGEDVHDSRAEREDAVSLKQGIESAYSNGSEQSLVQSSPFAQSYSTGNANTISGLGFSRFVEPFLFHYRLLLACLLTSVLLGWLALLVWPRTYESVAKLQLLVGRESVGLDPSSTTTQTLLMQKTLEEDVNSALEILGSRDVAELVVSEIGAESILSGNLPSDESGTKASGIREWVGAARGIVGSIAGSVIELSGVRDPISDHERAVIRLQDTVSVHAPKKSSTMIVAAQSKTPEMAQAIVSSFVRHFIERHVNVATTEGSHAFFEKQAQSAEGELGNLMQQRSDLLQENKLVSASNRFSSLTTQQSAIEASILNTIAQMKQTQAELDDLVTRIEELDAEIVSTKQTQPDQTIIGMRISLYNAELEEKRLLARFSDGHPQLKQVQKQVLAAREALDKLEQESESLSTTPNPIRLKLEEDLLRNKTRIVGLESLLEESKIQLTEKQQEIEELLQLELKLDQLDREIDVAKRNLSSLREKEEQSRVVENLRQQRISSVGVAQAASLARKATKPKKPLIALGAVMLGLGFGICLVGLGELTRKNLRTPEDVRRVLGYSVLAELPHQKGLNVAQLAYSEIRSGKLDVLKAACKQLQPELMIPTCQVDFDSSRGRTIGVVGVDDENGASTLAMALALQLSEDNLQRTTLVDLDTKKGTVSGVFELVGPKDQVVSADTLDDDSDRVLQVSDRSLNLVGSSSKSIACTGHGSLNSLLTMLDHVAESNDVVVLDFPPISRPDRVMAVVSHIDQVVVVVESQKTSVEEAQRLIRQLEYSGAKIAGVVLNKYVSRVPKWLEKLIG